MLCLKIYIFTLLPWKICSSKVEIILWYSFSSKIFFTIHFDCFFFQLIYGNLQSKTDNDNKICKTLCQSFQIQIIWNISARRMGCYRLFVRKNNFMSLLRNIWIKYLDLWFWFCLSHSNHLLLHLISCNVANNEVTSANSFRLHLRPSDKSLT